MSDTAKRRAAAKAAPSSEDAEAAEAATAPEAEAVAENVPTAPADAPDPEPAADPPEPEPEPESPVGQDTLPKAILVARAPSLLGVETHVARGVLAEAEDPITVEAAKARIDQFLNGNVLNANAPIEGVPTDTEEA